MNKNSFDIVQCLSRPMYQCLHRIHIIIYKKLLKKGWTQVKVKGKVKYVSSWLQVAVILWAQKKWKRNTVWLEHVHLLTGWETSSENEYTTGESKSSLLPYVTDGGNLLHFFLLTGALAYDQEKINNTFHHMSCMIT